MLHVLRIIILLVVARCWKYKTAKQINLKFRGSRQVMGFTLFGKSIKRKFIFSLYLRYYR